MVSFEPLLLREGCQNGTFMDTTPPLHNEHFYEALKWKGSGLASSWVVCQECSFPKSGSRETSQS